MKAFKLVKVLQKQPALLKRHDTVCFGYLKDPKHTGIVRWTGIRADGRQMVVVVWSLGSWMLSERSQLMLIRRPRKKK